MAPEARAREKAAGDEEATTELKLGEFQEVPTLTLSEARLLINAVMDHRRSGQRKIEETEYVLHYLTLPPQHDVISSCSIITRQISKLPPTLVI